MQLHLLSCILAFEKCLQFYRCTRLAIKETQKIMHVKVKKLLATYSIIIQKRNGLHGFTNKFALYTVANIRRSEFDVNDFFK